jgi:site-specific DNA-methyltransferase (adenine-specific)
MQKLLNKIICGDCIEVLSKVKKSFADLIFADPPFNIGYEYDK